MEYIVSIDDSSAGAVIIQLQSSNCGMYYRVYVQDIGRRKNTQYHLSSRRKQPAGKFRALVRISELWVQILGNT